jgi:hypothetical protein
MELGLDVSLHITVSAQGSSLAAVLAVDDVATRHLDMPLGHERLLHGILDTLDLEFLTADGAAEETLDDGGGHREGCRLILGREGVVAGDIPVGLEGTLDSKTDALLVEGFAATITLANGEFTSLKRVDSAEGELAGERFHGISLKG